MGVIGAQLYASAWRIDRTDLAEEVLPKDKSLGNSQVLPHDYTRAEEIEVVIREIGSQVASRLRAHDKQAGGVYLSIGYSLSTPTEETGFAHSLKLSDSRSLQTSSMGSCFICSLHTGMEYRRFAASAWPRLAWLTAMASSSICSIRPNTTWLSWKTPLTPSANALARRQSCGRPAWRRVARLSKEA